MALPFHRRPPTLTRSSYTGSHDINALPDSRIEHDPRAGALYRYHAHVLAARRMKGCRAASELARVVVFVLALMVSSLPAAGLEHDAQGWFLFTAQGPLHGDFKLFLEAQPRLGGDGMRQLILRPAAGYQITPQWSLWQGYAWTPTFHPFRVEHRSWQQSLLLSPWGRVRFVNRTRFEQRFLEGADGTSLRLRHMLRIVLPLGASQRWLLAAYDEPFFTLNDTEGGPQTGFNQNRAYLAIARRIGSHTNLELGYMAQYVRGSGSAEDVLSHNPVLWIERSW
jgi:hypothetical protein